MKKIERNKKLVNLIDAIFMLFFSVILMSLPALIITNFALNYLSQNISCISVELSTLVLVGSFGLVAMAIFGWDLFVESNKILNEKGDKKCKK